MIKNLFSIKPIGSPRLGQQNLSQGFEWGNADQLFVLELTKIHKLRRLKYNSNYPGNFLGKLNK